MQAIIYINDYPQKARWKVTNKDTMVQVSLLSRPSAGQSLTCMRCHRFAARRVDRCFNY